MERWRPHLPRSSARTDTARTARSTDPPSGGIGLEGRPMKYLLAFLVISFAISFGTAGIVYGELQDTPELMLVGMVLVVGAVALGARSVRRASVDGAAR